MKHDNSPIRGTIRALSGSLTDIASSAGTLPLCSIEKESKNSNSLGFISLEPL
jgi:hypothetical protein